MKYIEVEVTEILQKRIMVAVEDNSDKKEAVKEAEKLYFENKLRLGAADFADVSFGLS